MPIETQLPITGGRPDTANSLKRRFTPLEKCTVAKPERLEFDSPSSNTCKTKEMDLRIIGYTRVSTEEQGRSGLGLEAQGQAIQAQATAKGWEVIWLSDEGVSAKSLSRPALQEALALLRHGDAEAIVVSKLDRLSRSVHDFAGLLAVARKQGWAVTALDVGVDTTTSAGELVANVMVAVAQWERRVIGERTSVALRAAQARGIHVGRPRVLTRETQQRVYELRALGLSYARVAASLNAEHVPCAHGGTWHASTVSRVLQRTVN